MTNNTESTTRTIIITEEEAQYLEQLIKAEQAKIPPYSEWSNYLESNNTFFDHSDQNEGR
jgi:hypothetical protein